MKIIAHRGMWEYRNEMNTKVAFSRAIRNNYGIETDVRDYCGELVVSHDIPDGSNILSFDEFLYDYISGCKVYGVDVILAINIKSDGLCKKIFDILLKNKIDNYFLFDMSIPDSMAYLNLDQTVYYRISEFESVSALSQKIKGIWLDQFEGDWYSIKDLKNIINKWSNVCVVSPELHGRRYEECWSMLKGMHKEFNIMICTDLPNKAKEYFGES